MGTCIGLDWFFPMSCRLGIQVFAVREDGRSDRRLVIMDSHSSLFFSFLYAAACTEDKNLISPSFQSIFLPVPSRQIPTHRRTIQKHLIIVHPYKLRLSRNLILR
jgi:hypothetical protein